MISYDHFAALDIRIGEIRSAQRIPDTDKLLKLAVDLGEAEPRQIVSGIAAWFPDPETLVGRRCAFLANLEPRSIRGHVSEGMILAASTEDGAFALLCPDPALPPGTKVK
jgi:methionyl-tRNA synthetase